MSSRSSDIVKTVPESLEYRSISISDLLRKYTDGNWAERLREFEHKEWRCGNFKIGHKWLNPKGQLMCLLFIHDNPKGTRTVVQELREGNIHWYVEERGSASVPVMSVIVLFVPVFLKMFLQGLKKAFGLP